MTRAEPLYFGPEARPLFGWLHHAAAPSRLGVVLCKPFGYEAICAHRVLRHFAEGAAAAGLPALRFDYDGTGDSAGDDREPGRLEAWIASIGHAVDTLRAQAHVERVALVGVRLGALLAALAAERRDDVDGLVAIAPIVSGKAYVRELRALQQTTALQSAPTSAVIEEGVQPALGFLLTASTKAELSAVDLTCVPRAPAPAALLLERDDLPGDEGWPERLAALGVAVERRRLPGYVDMVLGAEFAQVPEEMLRATNEWLAARAARLGAPDAPRPAPPPPRREARFADVVERTELVDDAGRLFGILSTSAAPPASTSASRAAGPRSATPSCASTSPASATASPRRGGARTSSTPTKRATTSGRAWPSCAASPASPRCTRSASARAATTPSRRPSRACRSTASCSSTRSRSSTSPIVPSPRPRTRSSSRPRATSAACATSRPGRSSSAAASICASRATR
jgi:alpha-beta hydrolase superfamily lysophospholipase